MNNHSKVPFYRVILGIICAMSALGALFAFLGHLTGASHVPGDFLTSLLLTLLFGYLTCSCFIQKDKIHVDKNQKGDGSSSGVSKYKLYSILFRVLVFIVFITLFSLISALIDMPSSADPLSVVQPKRSGAGMAVSFLGWIVAGGMAYYCPVPKKWKENMNAAVKEQQTEKSQVENLKVEDVGKEEPNKQKELVYDREDVEL